MMYQFGWAMVKNVIRPVRKTLKSPCEITNEPEAVSYYCFGSLQTACSALLFNCEGKRNIHQLPSWFFISK